MMMPVNGRPFPRRPSPCAYAVCSRRRPPARLPPAAFAVDPSLFQDLHWRLIGPFRGGRVLAVSGVPGEPEHFYFGSVNGGVWETQRRRPHLAADLRRQPIGSIGAHRRRAVEPAA